MTNTASDSFLIASTLEGETFSLMVKGTRGRVALEIDSVEVHVKGTNKQCYGSYLFDSPLDPEGIERIFSLVEDSSPGDDLVVLRRLLAITDRHSCGNWSEIEKRGAGSSGPLRPARISFEDFVEDPQTSGRKRECSYSIEGLSLIARFEIAVWGEFLSVQVTEESGEFMPEMSHFKVLLPEKLERTGAVAYDELVALARRLAEEFSALGYSGLLAALKLASFEIISAVPLLEQRNSEGSLSRITIPLTYRQPRPASKTLVSLSISSAEAELRIESVYNADNSAIRIRILPGALFPEFTAGQIRAIRDLYGLIEGSEDLTPSRGASQILGMLMQAENKESPTMEAIHPVYRVPPDSFPGELSLSMLRASAEVLMPNLEYFLPREDIAVVMGGEAVVVEKRFSITLEVLRDVARGARLLVLRLPLRLAARRPDLVAFLVVTSYPTEGSRIRLVSGMGGARLFTLQESHQGTASRSRLDVGRICRVFSRQERGGWIPLMRLVQSLGQEQATEGAFAGLPAVDDVVGVQSFDVAARTLRYLLRGSGRDLWGFCSNSQDGGASLAIGSYVLEGALEVQFRGDKLVKITVRERTSAPALWDDVALFHHAGFDLGGNSLQDVVTILRVFFRDQIRATSGTAATPKRAALGSLTQSLRQRSFT